MHTSILGAIDEFPAKLYFVPRAKRRERSDAKLSLVARTTLYVAHKQVSRPLDVVLIRPALCRNLYTIYYGI